MLCAGAIHEHYSATLHLYLLIEMQSSFLRTFDGNYGACGVMTR